MELNFIVYLKLYHRIKMPRKQLFTLNDEKQLTADLLGVDEVVECESEPSDDVLKKLFVTFYGWDSQPSLWLAFNHADVKEVSDSFGQFNSIDSLAYEVYALEIPEYYDRAAFLYAVICTPRAESCHFVSQVMTPTDFRIARPVVLWRYICRTQQLDTDRFADAFTSFTASQEIAPRYSLGKQWICIKVTFQPGCTLLPVYKIRAHQHEFLLPPLKLRPHNIEIVSREFVSETSLDVSPT